MQVSQSRSSGNRSTWIAQSHLRHFFCSVRKPIWTSWHLPLVLFFSDIYGRLRIWGFKVIRAVIHTSHLDDEFDSMSFVGRIIILMVSKSIFGCDAYATLSSRTVLVHSNRNDLRFVQHFSDAFRMSYSMESLSANLTNNFFSSVF